MTGAGMLYTVTGPSGAGKSSLLEALRALEPTVQVSVSCTTRRPADDEVEGREYFFVDDAQFDRMLEQNAFLEHAEVFGHRYGTSSAWVRQHLVADRDVILEIDWVGARAVRGMPWPSASIFILPPSLPALSQRLRQRQRDSDGALAARIGQASADIGHYRESDYVIVNDDFERSLQSLRAIVLAGRLRREAQERRHAERLRQILNPDT